MVCTLTAIPRGFEADVFTGWLDDLPNCNQQHRITDDTTYFEWGHLSSSFITIIWIFSVAANHFAGATEKQTTLQQTTDQSLRSIRFPFLRGR